MFPSRCVPSSVGLPYDGVGSPGPSGAEAGGGVGKHLRGGRFQGGRDCIRDVASGSPCG